MTAPYEDFDFDAWYEQQEREQREWEEWWDALSPEDQKREREMMDAHYEAQQTREPEA